MHVNDILNDRQADSGSARITGTRIINSEEPLEKIIYILLGNSPSVIGNFNSDPVAYCRNGNIDLVRSRLAFVRYVLDRIRKKIDDNSHEEILITVNERIVHVLGNLDLDLVSSGILGNRCDSLADDLTDIYDSHGDLVLTHRQCKEVLNDILHPYGIGNDSGTPGLDLLISRHIIRSYIINKELGCADNRKRSLKLVRYIRSEVLLTSLVILKLGDIIDDDYIQSHLIIYLMKDLYLEDLITAVVINSYGGIRIIYI